MINDNEVGLALNALKRNDGTMYFQLKVPSVVKPKLFAQSPQVDFSNADAKRILVAAAGACAEYLGEQYGDNIDPTECAKAAVRAFDRLVDQINKPK